MLSNYFINFFRKDNFKLKLNLLLKFLKNKKIIIYGIGEELIKYLREYEFNKLNILAITDSTCSVADVFENIKVIPYSKVYEYDFDYILIAQDNLVRAEKFLTKDLKIDKSKIINILRNSIFDKEIYLNYLNRLNFKKHFSKLAKKLNNKKVILYGATELLEAINEICDLKKINILAISDMKFKMKQDEFLGYKTCPTYEITKYNPDYVVVVDRYYDKELIELLYFTSLKNTDIKIFSILNSSIFSNIADILFKDNIAKNKPILFKTKYNRIKNYLYNVLHNKVLYNTYTPYVVPDTIRLEASTLCQLKCPACHMRKYDHSALGDGSLKFDDYKKIIEDAKIIKKVSLSNNGEIFLNPDLYEIIKYSYEHNIELDADTGVNLNYLTDKLACALVEYKFNRLILSIDGASQETYSQYRINGNFDTVIENIKKINYYKNKFNSQYPRLIWKFILFNHNEHEVVKAKQLAHELNTEIIFAFPWGDNTYIPKDPEFIKK